MKLREARKLFDKLRVESWRIVLTFHVLHDHPERGFTADTLVSLVQGTGRLADNKMPSAIDDSFLWLCKDHADRACELVVKFSPLDETPGELVLVISAFREVLR